MRKGLLFIWLLLPVLVGFYHAGPGQRNALLDTIAAQTAEAERAVEAGDWATAIKLYTAAAEMAPADRPDIQRHLRFERAKAELNNEQLPAAYQEFAALESELRADGSDQALLNAVLEARANSQYYVTWLMRLEGEPRDVWEPQIEAARQTFRYLSEQAVAAESDQVDRYQENLEATIRLARMELGDLQALALPSACKGCCSGACCGGKKKPGKGKKGGKKKPDDARGASSGPPPDGSGS